jgi:excisionase family DNA binding protein
LARTPPLTTELTPAEAAKLLNVSGPAIARLLDSGALPSTRQPGSCRRVVRLADVLTFQERRQRRRAGRRQIAEAVSEANLPY